jgi:hypothetical protein
MVLSSHSALNKVGGGSTRQLNDYITQQLASPSMVVDGSNSKPAGLHFVVLEKIFKGTNQPYVSCPIQFLLRDSTGDTILCQPVWTEKSLRSKVNRKAKVGVKKHSVIRLDDFSVVAHKKALSGFHIFIRSYLVVKKDIEIEAYQRWNLE